MSLEFTLLTTAMKALDKATGKWTRNEAVSTAGSWRDGNQPDTEPRCPKCHGPMNPLLARANAGVSSRTIVAWLCDNPKCEGLEPYD